MADVELLPCAECGMPCRAGEYHPFAACLMFKACHNSATVRANLAPLQAEIEALRAEVETWKTYARGKHDLWQESVRHAERLAEALRKLEEREQSDETLLRQALEALERGAWDTLSGRNAAFAIRERIGLGQEE